MCIILIFYFYNNVTYFKHFYTIKKTQNSNFSLKGPRAPDTGIFKEDTEELDEEKKPSPTKKSIFKYRNKFMYDTDSDSGNSLPSIPPPEDDVMVISFDEELEKSMIQMENTNQS